MSIELLESIKRAEQEAEAIRAEALKGARELIKQAEEQIALENRQASVYMRESSQKVLQSAREATQDEIRTLELRRAKERERVREAALQKVEGAGKAIFERIVDNGYR